MTERQTTLSVNESADGRRLPDQAPGRPLFFTWLESAVTNSGLTMRRFSLVAGLRQGACHSIIRVGNWPATDDVVIALGIQGGASPAQIAQFLVAKHEHEAEVHRKTAELGKRPRRSTAMAKAAGVLSEFNLGPAANNALGQFADQAFAELLDDAGNRKSFSALVREAKEAGTPASASAFSRMRTYGQVEERILNALVSVLIKNLSPSRLAALIEDQASAIEEQADLTDRAAIIRDGKDIPHQLLAVLLLLRKASRPSDYRGEFRIKPSQTRPPEAGRRLGSKGIPNTLLGHRRTKAFEAEPQLTVANLVRMAGGTQALFSELAEDVALLSTTRRLSGCTESEIFSETKFPGDWWRRPSRAGLDRWRRRAYGMTGLSHLLSGSKKGGRPADYSQKLLEQAEDLKYGSKMSWGETAAALGVDDPDNLRKRVSARRRQNVAKPPSGTT